DTHSVTAVAPSAGALGALAASVTTDDSHTSGTGGVITWNYAVADSALQYLAQGQSKVETFTISLFDGTSTVTKDVTVTITGTNDNAVITVAAGDSASGAVTEDAHPLTETASGTLSFSDVDLQDTHSVTGVAPSAGALGTLTASVTTDDSHTTGTGGVITWNYSVADNAIQYLAQGQTKVETFTISLSDGTSTVTKDVTVTITGTNDAPDIHLVTTDSAATTLTETNAGLSSSGTLTVNDPDVSDTVSSSVTTVVASGTTTGLGLTNAQLLAMLGVSPTSGLAADPADTHNLTWNFNSGTQAFDYLAAGQSLVLTYTVQSTDSSASPLSDTQTVTVTINGTNDAPDIHLVATGTADSATATLNETNVGLTTNGTLTVTDADLSDTVSSTVTTVV